MATTLADGVKLVKRRRRYGDVAVTSDQITEDIIRFINLRRRRFWRKWYWDWSLEDISISITAADVALGTTDYTLGSTVGDIWILEAGGDDYLKHLTMKEYYQWKKRANEGAGEITHYVKLGRNSSGNFRLRFWRTPSEAVTITGFGKKRLTNYTVADIASNTGLEYFPEDVLDTLWLGVESDIAESMGDKVKADILDAKFESEMNTLVAQEQSQKDEEIKAPPPDYYVRKKRARGGTTVV